jgi:hypothetical protein
VKISFKPYSGIQIQHSARQCLISLRRKLDSFSCKEQLLEKHWTHLLMRRKEFLNYVFVSAVFFSHAGPIREQQYHPLALRALAVYYHEIDNMNILSWEKHLEDLDKLKHSRESSDVFGILGLQFSTFDTRKKLLFLDLALYYGTSWKSLKNCVRWLADIHEETRRAIECQVSVSS